MVEKTSGIPLGPAKPLTPIKGITHVRHKDTEERLVPDRKKTPDKKPPGVGDDEQETPEGSSDNKIDIRA